MCTKQFDTPVTGNVNISTANSNLNGSGTLGTVISGANHGTSLSVITVKAVNATTQGMVRLFIGFGGSYFLWREVMVPASTPTGVEKSFYKILSVNLLLKNGHTLYASTENAESFNIIATGITWTNCNCPE